MYAKAYKNTSALVDKIRSGEYTKEEQTKTEQREGLLRRPDLRKEKAPEKTQEDRILDYMVALRSQNEEMASMMASQGSPEGTVEGRGDAPSVVEGKPVAPPKNLMEDTAFMAKLDEMVNKYDGLTHDEVFRTIKGESGGKLSIQNKNSKATGLFQFIPDTAKALGTTVEAIKNMDAREQLELYDQYLEMNEYQGGSLGIMQAAPAYANADPDEVIYAKGSKAWEQNPGWRDKTGLITKRSINNYYRRQA
jgi:hypothetical protein